MDALTLAHHLTPFYRVTVLYGEKEKDETEAIFSEENSPVFFIKIGSLHRSIRPFQDYISYRAILKIIKQQKPDIVHTHGFKTGLLGRIAAKRAGVPVIIHTYHGHLFHSYYNRRISKFICLLERKLASVSDKIIAVSPQQAYEISNVYHIAPPHKIETIFIGIDAEDYWVNPDPNAGLRKPFQIPENAVLIGIIGRLVKIKNHSLFIRVAQRILNKGKDVYFFIIGEGEEKKYIQKQLTEQHLLWEEGHAGSRLSNIYFTSWISNISPALQDIDIVLLTSLNEGTPVSLMEAQLLQIPVVASNVGGVRDTLADNESGFLINDNDVDQFVEKLQLLIQDKTLRNKMGMAGKKFVEERFSKEKEVASIYQLYIDCLRYKKTRF